MSISFLHPELAAERSADLGRGTLHDGERHGFIVRTGQSAGEDAERAEWTVRCQWWSSHYWGRPDRKTERELALLRGVAAGHDAETMTPLMRTFLRA